MSNDRPSENLQAVLCVIEDSAWRTGTEFMQEYTTKTPPGEIRRKIELAIQSREDQGKFLEAARLMMFRLVERNHPRTLQLYDRAIQYEIDRGRMHQAADIAYEARYFTRASQLYRTAGNIDMAKHTARLQPLEREVNRAS